ncbi:PD40 domain-containing protein [Candidatus Poribacteria bacterium]|nr:PD40 domain-containing protein [Candidatus Poribacteria bacterium]
MKMRKTLWIMIIAIVFALGDVSKEHQAYGSRIAFVSFFEGVDTEICVINPDRTVLQNLTNNPKSSSIWPIWSPDGKKIAYVDFLPSRLYQMDADGKNVTLLKADYPDFQSRPAYSPDGKEIAFGASFRLLFWISTRGKRGG